MNETKTSHAGAPASAKARPRAALSHRILVVDEDSDLRLQYAFVLGRPGYHIDVAEDGAAGWEALQAYWFCHLAVITELNGWDSFNPGHLDQHLLPFYERGLADGSLTPESARELLECFFIKFNNHPAPPKVGVTAAESGTYTDFANINIGGLLRDGSNGASAVSHILLDIVDEMHLLQPSSNIQLSRKSPDAFLEHALKVVSRGYGFPSIFNADAVVQEQLRQGKTVEDARAGGCSGCVEVGARYRASAAVLSRPAGHAGCRRE